MAMSFPRQVLPGRVYLITRRCTQREYRLRPGEETNNAFVYCLAHAALSANIGVVGFMAESNHYHAVVVDNEGRLPEFLADFHRNIAKHQNVLLGSWENMWAAGAPSVVELVEPGDVLAKLIYALSNPVKDDLVDTVHHWPGVSSLRANLRGSHLTAVRPRRFFRIDGAMPVRIELRCVRAPGFEHLSEDAYRHLIKTQIEAVERTSAADRAIRGVTVLGRKAILRQSPFGRPSSEEPRRGLDPRVAATDKWSRIEAIARLKAFREAYRAARAAWLMGDASVLFPAGTYFLRRFARVTCDVCVT